MEIDDILKRISDRLESLKDDLYDSTGTTGLDDNLMKIVKLDKVDDEVYEVIVLLYSKFKSDAQLLRSDSYRIMVKTIDSLMELIMAFKYINEGIAAAHKAKEKRSNIFLKMTYVGFILLGVSAFVSSMFVLFRLDNNTGKLVIDLLKTITHVF